MSDRTHPYSYSGEMAGKAVAAVHFERTQYERFRQPLHEFAKFAVIGIAGVFVPDVNW
jgi:hypothetical protein